MADAKALFKRHYAQYIEMVSGVLAKDPSDIQLSIMANLYSACIIAEAIRNGLDDPES